MGEAYELNYNNDPSYYWQSMGDAGGQWVRRSDSMPAVWQSQGDAGGVYVSPEGQPLQFVGGGDGGYQALTPVAPYAPPAAAPVAPAAPAVPDYAAMLAQFAGGMLNRGPIGVPQVRLGGNYAPMYAMPNSAAQPFSFINPGSGGLLGNASGNGSMGSAQPFGAALSGGLLGGAK